MFLRLNWMPLGHGCGEKKKKWKALMAGRRVIVRIGSVLDHIQAWKNWEEVKEEVRSQLLAFCDTNYTIFWAWPFKTESNHKSNSIIYSNLKARYATSKLSFSYPSKWRAVCCTRWLWGFLSGLRRQMRKSSWKVSGLMWPVPLEHLVIIS